MGQINIPYFAAAQPSPVSITDVPEPYRASDILGAVDCQDLSIRITDQILDSIVSKELADYRITIAP